MTSADNRRCQHFFTFNLITCSKIVQSQTDIRLVILEIWRKGIVKLIPPPKKLISKCPALLGLKNLVIYIISSISSWCTDPLSWIAFGIPVFAAEAAAVKPNGNNTILAERIASLINGHANLLSTIEWTRFKYFRYLSF